MNDVYKLKKIEFLNNNLFTFQKVGPRSDLTSLHCLCNHLTSFGGGVLVMPNKLDFDVVFEEFGRLGETGNVAVLSAIVVALLLYLLVVIFGRRADKRDKTKVKKLGFLLFGRN